MVTRRACATMVTRRACATFVIPALLGLPAANAVEEAVQGMSAGGIRRIIVPEEIGYPADGYRTIGPKPSTFSGERALDFVLASKSSMMDKTLMFDLKLTNVKPR